MTKALNKIKIKLQLVEMLKGGVIFEVADEDQAVQAMLAGGRGVMPVTISESEDEVRRMATPEFVRTIVDCVALPIIAQVRIGHVLEARIMEKVGANIIDESNELSYDEDDRIYIEKTKLITPFICGANNFFEVARAIAMGAAMIRIYSESGGNCMNIASRLRIIKKQKAEIKEIMNSPSDEESVEELNEAIEEYGLDRDMLKKLVNMDKIPVPIFASNFTASPDDAALLMTEGFDGVFIGTDVFDGENAIQRANGIVKAVANYKNLDVLADISNNYH